MSADRIATHGQSPSRTASGDGARTEFRQTPLRDKPAFKGATTAHVEIEVGGAKLTASITNEAVEELKLKKGQKAYAVIKASDVMIGVD